MRNRKLLTFLTVAAIVAFIAFLAGTTIGGRSSTHTMPDGGSMSGMDTGTRR